MKEAVEAGDIEAKKYTMTRDVEARRNAVERPAKNTNIFGATKSRGEV